MGLASRCGSVKRVAAWHVALDALSWSLAGGENTHNREPVGLSEACSYISPTRCCGLAWRVTVARRWARPEGHDTTLWSGIRFLAFQRIPGTIDLMRGVL
eukprot:scaffold72818_cov57-Phaeocystis_antarctica.AAC.2